MPYRPKLYSIDQLNDLASTFLDTRLDVDRAALLSVIPDTVAIWYLEEDRAAAFDIGQLVAIEVDRAIPGYSGSLRPRLSWNPKRASFYRFLRILAKSVWVDFHRSRVLSGTDEIQVDWDRFDQLPGASNFDVNEDREAEPADLPLVDSLLVCLDTAPHRGIYKKPPSYPIGYARDARFPTPDEMAQRKARGRKGQVQMLLCRSKSCGRLFLPGSDTGKLRNICPDCLPAARKREAEVNRALNSLSSKAEIVAAARLIEVPWKRKTRRKPIVGRKVFVMSRKARMAAEAEDRARALYVLGASEIA